MTWHLQGRQRRCHHGTACSVTRGERFSIRLVDTPGAVIARRTWKCRRHGKNGRARMNQRFSRDVIGQWLVSGTIPNWESRSFSGVTNYQYRRGTKYRYHRRPIAPSPNSSPQGTPRGKNPKEELPKRGLARRENGMISWHDVRVSLLSMPIPDYSKPKIPSTQSPAAAVEPAPPSRKPSRRRPERRSCLCPRTFSTSAREGFLNSVHLDGAIGELLLRSRVYRPFARVYTDFLSVPNDAR